MRTPEKIPQVYDELLRRLEAGQYPPGSALPQENLLASALQISRKTLRGALARLELENWIERRRGRGNFVRERMAFLQKILLLRSENSGNDSAYPAMLSGIQTVARSRQVKVDECPIAVLEHDLDYSARKIIDLGYDGIICDGTHYTGKEKILTLLRNTNLPVLIPHGTKQDAAATGFAVMGTDYPALVLDGLRYLRQTGHFRVAYIGYRQMRLPRLAYRRYLQKVGLCTRPEYILSLRSHDDDDKIRQDIQSLFHLSPLPTALFCFSDRVAMCAYDVIRDNRLEIPEDIAVLTIGGFYGCDFANPPLSAMDFDSEAIGRQAMEMLLKMIHDHCMTMPFTVTPHHLTERKSTLKMLHC